MFFQPNSINKNDLIYQVANYNFSNFVVSTFDLTFDNQIEGINMLQVNSFKSFDDVNDYLNRAFEKDQLMTHLDKKITPIPISRDNYEILMSGKSLDEYLTFFTDSLGKQAPKLESYWKKQKDGSLEDADSLKTAASSKPKVVPEPVAMPKDSTLIQPVDSLVEQASTLEKAQGAKAKTIIGLDSDTIAVAKDSLAGQSQELDKMQQTVSDIMDNPVDGIKSLLTPVQKPKLTKEEKEQLKLEKEQQKMAARKQEAENKAKQDSINNEQKRAKDVLRNEARQKEQAKINAEQQKKLAKKEAEKQKKDKIKEAEKAREDKLKQREVERKAKEKARNEELKAKEKARKEKLKQKEEERAEKLKEKKKKATLDL